MTGSRDLVLVRRAGRRVALQTAALVGAALVAVVLLGTLVTVRTQAAADDRELRSAAVTADDVDDPPAGTWLILERGGRVSATRGLPDRLQAPLTALRATAIAGEAHLTTLTLAGDVHYRVATLAAAGKRVQVVLDLAPVYADRARLLTTMTAAALVGLLVAAGVGVVVGREAARPLASALALQRAFVADASHELRTPLTLLSTRAQVLDLALHGADLPDEVRADSRGLVQDVHRLGDVVEDLLIAADPSAQSSPVLLDVEKLAHDAVTSAGAHAALTGVHLRVETDGADAYPVLGSETSLRRALLALLDNAIGHSPAGGGVIVALARTRTEVRVSVSDEGPGIAPRDAERIMRRFSSGGQRAGRAHYGLGLALTSDVADRHGGHLSLADVPRGARFDLVLPVAGVR